MSCKSGGTMSRKVKDDKFTKDFWTGVLDRAYNNSYEKLGLPKVDDSFTAFLEEVFKEREKKSITLIDSGSQTEEESKVDLDGELKSLEVVVNEKRRKWSDALNEAKSGQSSKGNTGDVPKTSSASQGTKKRRVEALPSSQQFQGSIIKKVKVYNDGKDRPFKCSVDGCDARFTRKRSLRQHVISKHEMKKYPCNTCGKQYSNNRNLTQHMMTMHVHDPCFCDVCSKEFRNSTSLRRHMGLHDDRFRCTICSRRCISDYARKLHERRHFVQIKSGSKETKAIRNGKLQATSKIQLEKVKSYRQKVGRVETKVKGQIYVKTDSEKAIITTYVFDEEKYKAAAILYYIPFFPQHQTVTAMGHFVVSTEESPFTFIQNQIRKSGVEFRGGGSCTHKSEDMYDGKEDDYDNIIVLAAADSVETCRDLKFFANSICAVSNMIVQQPQVFVLRRPGTIVGSAAFNLLAITAVCIVAIPSGEGRSIRLINVFWVTSVFSFFAYVWLLIVLEFISPDVVELWEAILTLLFFPILVVLAWWADRGFKIGRRKPIPTETGGQDHQIELGVITRDRQRSKPTFYDEKGELIQEELIEFYKDLRKYPYLTEQDAVTLAAAKLMDSRSRSRLWYRIGAVRDFAGMKKVHPSLTKKLQVVYDAINSHPDVTPTTDPVFTKLKKSQYPPNKAIIEFHSASFAVPENVGHFNVSVIRHGRMDNAVRVRVESFDGTAKQGSDYISVDEQIEFGPNIREKEVTVRILDDNQWEPDEEFFLRLSLVDDESWTSRDGRKDVALGKLPIMEVVILDDDEPGVLSFRKRGLLVKESCGVASLEVERSNGADGEIAVKWRTIDGSATSPTDYQGGEGTLIFKHGEILRSIDIPIVNDASPEKDECFEVELFNPLNGSRLGRITKVAVTISNDDDFNSVLQRWTEMTAASLKAMQVHQESYKSQIYDAVTVNGGNIEEATDFDYFMHIISFFWKVIFSLIPPPHLLGGWLCFVCSLVAIGILTAVIGDLATIFGLIVGLKDPVTAITFVALGTSLPDLFASKTAAAKEKHADNAIGNVTGSNSVNVFLGLGLPWVMASIYHEAHGEKFNVPSGNIGFSVLVYSLVAFIALGLIMLRRYLSFFGKTELGGPNGPKWGSAIVLIILWFTYIILSSLNSYYIIKFNI